MVTLYSGDTVFGWPGGGGLGGEFTVHQILKLNTAIRINALLTFSMHSTTSTGLQQITNSIQ